MKSPVKQTQGMGLILTPSLTLMGPFKAKANDD